MVQAVAIVVSNVGARPSSVRAMEEQSLARRHLAANCVDGLGVVVAQQLVGAGGQSRGGRGRVGGVGSQHFGACVCRRRRLGSAGHGLGVVVAQQLAAAASWRWRAELCGGQKKSAVCGR